MYEQVRWYLIASSLVVLPCFFLSAWQWWTTVAKERANAVRVTKIGLRLAMISYVPLLAFLLVVSRDPHNSHITLQNLCRWSGEGLAILAIACAMTSRGWMRVVLAAFSAWSFAVSFYLLHPLA